VTGDANALHCSWLRGPCQALSDAVPTTTTGGGDVMHVCTCTAPTPDQITTCDSGLPAVVTPDCLTSGDGAAQTCVFRQVCVLPVGVDCSCPDISTLELADREPIVCADGSSILPTCHRALDSNSHAVCTWVRADCPQPAPADPCATVQCADGTHCVAGHCPPNDWSWVLTFHHALDDTTRGQLESTLRTELASRFNRDASDITVQCSSDTSANTTSCVVSASQHTASGDADPVESRTAGSDNSEAQQQTSVEQAGQASATTVGSGSSLLTATPNSSANGAATNSGAASLVVCTAVVVAAVLALMALVQ